MVNVANGKGTFVIANGGLAGKLSGDVTITAASFSGNFTVEFNTSRTAVNQTFVIDGQPVVLNLAAGPYFRVDPHASLSFAGQSISGDFAFEVVTPAGGSPMVRVSAANVSFALGDGTTNFLAMTNGRGSFVLSQAGIAGELTGDIAVNIPGVTLAGTLELQINTTKAAVNQTFDAADGTKATINLPAGPVPADRRDGRVAHDRRADAHGRFQLREDGRGRRLDDRQDRGQ